VLLLVFLLVRPKRLFDFWSETLCWAFGGEAQLKAAARHQAMSKREFLGSITHANLQGTSGLRNIQTGLRNIQIISEFRVDNLVRCDNPDLTQKYIFDSELRKKSLGVIDVKIRGGLLRDILFWLCTYFKVVCSCVYS